MELWEDPSGTRRARREDLEAPTDEARIGRSSRQRLSCAFDCEHSTETLVIAEADQGELCVTFISA
jgi:hypothetical protein